MRSALLIVLLQAHLAACCGPVVSRSPAINSSGAKARSDQRAKEPPKPSVPLVTWATEEPEEPRALEFTDSPPLASLPPTTEAPPPFPFHPYDPDESTGTDKALEPGDLPRDCADVQNSGISDTSGVYRIFRPSCLNPEKCGKDVSCDLQTDGGGWTIIQQREDGDMDFFRDWASYRNGFGDDHSFWIGNEYMYEVTTMLGQSYHLLVQVTDFDGRSKFSVYDKFAVSDELTNYTLSLGKMFGEEEDVDNFLPNRNAPFGTYDYDTDEKTTEVCGALWQSGWWHDPLCRPSGNLNVPYEPSQNLSAPTIGLRWRDDTGSVRVKSVQMKIRPKSFNPLLLVNFRSKNDKNDGGGEPSANGGESSANGGQPSAKGGRLALNFRSLHHSGKKLDGQSTAAWRRYRR